MAIASAGYRLSLRARIILALVLIVTVTSTVFASGVLLIKQRLEGVIYGEMVREELATLVTQLESGDYSEGHLFNDWKLHFGDSVDDLPAEIRRLSPGSHHSVVVDGHHYQVEVGEWRGNPVYLTYDITQWEEQEHEVLKMQLYGVGLVLLAAIMMGRQASRAVLAPVRALTARLTAIEPGQRKLRIAGEFHGSEIGEIAAAFDRYLERLDRFVERERSFTAAASHELRTPLSVMLGAVDVLEANADSPAACRAIARIRRACGEMQGFIEATLFLSRESGTPANAGEGPVDLRGIIHGLLEDNASLLKERKIRVLTRFDGTAQLRQPAGILQITLGNILRNAIEHTREGEIEIHLHALGVEISDTGEGIHPDALDQVYERSYTTKPGGTGMGLNLVKRICDRFGWHIRIRSAPGRGTRVAITFAQASGDGSA